MDAACAASAIVGLIFNCATAVQACCDLRGKYKNADQTLRSIATEGSTLRASLLQLQHLMLRDPVALSSRWDVKSMLPQTFETAIESFTTVLAAFLLELEKYNFKPGSSPGTTLARSLKIKLLWNESAMQDVLVQLRAHQQSLQFLLTILQMFIRAPTKIGTIYKAVGTPTIRITKEKEPSRRRPPSPFGPLYEDTSAKDTNSEDDKQEPPAKGRSLSPEEGSEGPVLPSPSTPQTRSGKVYSPSSPSTSTHPDAPRNMQAATDYGRQDVENSSRSTFTNEKQPQNTSDYYCLCSRDKRHARNQDKGRYSLGRSLSPSSSTLGSPLPPLPSNHTGNRRSSNSTSSPSYTQTYGYQTPPYTSKDTSKAGFTLDSPGQQPVESDHRNMENEMCIDPVTPDTLPRASQNNSKSARPRNYSSPQIESDSEDSPPSSVQNASQSRTCEDYPKDSSSKDSRSAHEDPTENTIPIQLSENTSCPQPGVYTPYKLAPRNYAFSARTLPNGPRADAYGYSPRESFLLRYISSGYYSTASAEFKTDGTSPRKATTPPVPRPRVATEADARKHRLPPSYSLKNWDPSEEPLILLGSVFDSHSLGKWIYDWTVYHHGPGTPLFDMAGELWLLLTQLAGKVKCGEERMPRIRKMENREMMEEFIESSERLTDKFKRLLKACETPMLKAGKNHSKNETQLGQNAGTEFVNSIFGQDRQLENTEKFMSSIRLWNLRFYANCEDVLRRPQK